MDTPLTQFSGNVEKPFDIFTIRRVPSIFADWSIIMNPSGEGLKSEHSNTVSG